MEQKNLLPVKITHDFANVKNLLRNDFDAGYIEKWTRELDVFESFAQRRRRLKSESYFALNRKNAVWDGDEIQFE